MDAIDPLTSAVAGNTSPNFSKADQASASFSADFESFLKIFVTQLENQDPLEPQDSSDFTAQIAQFSTVEQAVQTNQNLEDILGIFQNDNNSNVVSFSGKFVEVEGDTITLTSEGADNTFSYTLENPARQAFVSIFNTDGETVFNGEAITEAGLNYLTWDGTDNNGNPAPAGIYVVQVGITDQEGNAQTVKTVVKGRVDGINFDEDPTLLVNGTEIPLDDVKFVGEA